MFIQRCKDLDFPSECLPILEKAYLSVTENSESNILFQTASDYLLHNQSVLYDEATAKILEITNLHPYTLNLILCVSCLEPLTKIYEEAGQKDKFDKYAESLKPQLIKCKEDSGVWGLTEGFWQWMFHEWQCKRLGRLEFEPFYYFFGVPYKGIKKGDPVILIHIPGGSPLDMDEVMESLELGYNHFKDQFKNEVVPFVTHSWLLYPPYLNGVFKEGGNLQKFAKLFDIIEQNSGEYINFSNVFKCPYPGEDLSGVPQKTSLQRNMLKFIMDGNDMGQGSGAFLYDKNGIVRE